MRHEFYAPERQKIGAQAGWRCANPECGAATIAGKSGGDDEGFQTLGRAAHITAASPLGPRYDAGLTERERRSAGNGIWLCNICAQTVDSDMDGYSAETLREWKRQAKDGSIAAALRYAPSAPDAPASAEVPTLEKVLAAAKADLATFKAGPRWPAHPVKLQLHLFEREVSQPFDADSLARVTEVYDDLVLVAPPGTGKSTSLIQIADAVNEVRGVPAIFVRLNDWAAQGRALLDLVAARHAFRGCTLADLQTLAEAGELCIALDGWNELDPPGETRARAEIETLRRQYPEISIVLSTRRQALPAPLTGQVVELDLLSEAQQVEIAEALKGDDGRALVEQAWRTTGVRDLVASPLYLTALLENATAGKLPTTRAEVLALFIRQHERDPANAAVMRQTLQGQQDAILAALAAEATTLGVTALRQEDAVAAVARAREVLTAAGLAADLPPALQIIDTLVAHHCLVRADGAKTPVSFEHQQIQEWFASRVVIDVMRAAPRDPGAAARLRTEFLNHYDWEEPILFACEALAADGEAAVDAVAAAILAAMEIDPLLSAEMIFRSSEPVWALIAAKVQDFISRWHRPGRSDRAFQFMMRSGRPEFAPVVWPLVAHEDHQVQARALHGAGRIRIQVFGPDLAAKIAALAEEPRRHLLSDIAQDGDFDGLTLAASVAAMDPSAKVQVEIVQQFAFRQADSFIDRIVEVGGPDFWSALAGAKYPARLKNVAAYAKLQAARGALLGHATSPNDRLVRLVEDDDDGMGGDLPAMADAIADPHFNFEHAYHFSRVARRYPALVAAALVRRMEAGLSVPHGTPEMLRAAQVTSDSDALCAIALDPQLPPHSTLMSAVSAIAGPKIISALFDAVFEADRKVEAAGTYVAALSDLADRLQRQLSKAKPRLVIDGVVARAEKQDARTVALLCAVISGLGGAPEDGERPPLDGVDDLIEVMKRWGGQFLADPTTPRSVFDRLARAIARVGAGALLPLARDGLAWELAQRSAAIEARMKNPANQNDSAMSYSHSYRGALVAIGGEEAEDLLKSYLGNIEFGGDAAVGLRQLWAKRAGWTPPDPFKGPRFGAAAQARAGRQARQDQGIATEIDPSAKAIIDTIPQLIGPDASDRQRSRAFELAAIAINLPHRDDPSFCAQLFALPGLRRGKLALIKAMIDAGYVVPAQRLVDGIEAVFDAAKADTWILTQQHSELADWIDFFGATDNPEFALDAIPRLRDHDQRAWMRRGLLTGLKQFPSAAAERTLVALAERDHDFYKEHEWRAAMIAQGTVTATTSIISAAVQLDGQGRDHWAIGREIGALLRARPSLRADLYDLLRSTDDIRAMGLLQNAITEAPDAEALFIVIDRYQALGRAYDNALHELLRKLALGERQTDPNANWYEIFGVPLTETRRRLFAMTAPEDPRRGLTTACLADLDDLRDEFGQVPAAPRHPDIAAGRPWPLAVG